jgi:hypothetical protein
MKCSNCTDSESSLPVPLKVIHNFQPPDLAHVGPVLTFHGPWLWITCSPGVLGHQEENTDVLSPYGSSCCTGSICPTLLFICFLFLCLFWDRLSPCNPNWLPTNSQSCCLSLPNAGITVMHHYAWLVWLWLLSTCFNFQSRRQFPTSSIILSEGHLMGALGVSPVPGLSRS